VSEIGELLAQNPYVVILVRMGLVAAFVVLVAVLAERLGAFLGAMVASLPLYTGPVYLMLALERDTDWLAQATLGSIAICGISPVFVLVYCMFAIGHGAGVSLGAAVLVWMACALVVQSVTWTLPQALLFVAPIYVVTIVLARSFTRGIAPARAERRWTDLALRAAMVAILSGFTMWVSAFVPPQVAGVLSVAPVLTASLVLVLHPRIGGRPTAALLAHTLAGLVGMVLAFSLVHLTIRQIGTAAALGSGLVVTVVWNVMLVVANRLMAPSEPDRPARSRGVSSGRLHG
jgi:hypothetical protein